MPCIDPLDLHFVYAAYAIIYSYSFTSLTYPGAFPEADSHVYASMVAEVQEAADRLRTKYAQLMRERGVSR